MSEKWYRVSDPISPLYGCDVKGYEIDSMFGPDDGMVLCALRRIDIFKGDRPFQLVAPVGEDLGIIISCDQLCLSPLQDDIVELATDLPYGRFLEESELFVSDLVLNIVTYERAHQVALRRPPTTVVASKVTVSGRNAVDAVRLAFEQNRPVEEIVMMIERL